MPRHKTTTECATGLGSKVARKQKVKAGKSNIWNPSVCYIIPEKKTKSSFTTPPSCGVEFLRMTSSNYLRKQLTKLRKSYRNDEDDGSMKPAVMAYERWLMRYFLQNTVTTDDDDPIIPSPSDDMEIDAGFVEDLVKTGGDTEETAIKVVEAFYKLSKTAALAISKERSEYKKSCLENVVVLQHRHSFDVILSKNKDKLLKINPAHYEKLKVMYTKQQSTEQEPEENKRKEKEEKIEIVFNVAEFHRRLFLCPRSVS